MLYKLAARKFENGNRKMIYLHDFISAFLNILRPFLRDLDKNLEWGFDDKIKDKNENVDA
jgi:hypothetical protein